MSAQVWLITGSSRGLGWEIALAAQQAGHIVIASSRNPSKDADKVKQIEEKGGAWARLDVSSSDLEKQLDVALEKHGKIDVLINCAGYALCGAFEDTNIETQQSLMQTNFWGPLCTMQHLLPSMRKRRSGTIVNITSAEAFRAIPTLATYAASKHALHAATSVVRQEVAQFGIRVLEVAPGAIRTGFNDAATLCELSEPYGGTVSDHVMQMLLASGGKQTGDPKKMALRIVEAVDYTGHVKDVVDGTDGLADFDLMFLGSDVGSMAKESGANLTSKVERLEGIWASVDIEDV
ncbi:MAG: hypothetical protein M1821_008445 [Bathelium mastoideum]|nr:MAG: hypothetical protein M1821_008445 [Bathelium mastoideum]